MAHDRSVVICGLPESGKTTFLAALWHLVTSREVQTALEFHSLRDGNQVYLNEIAKRWREGKVQGRTNLGPPTLVSMNLLDRKKTPIRLTFPDLNGESYRRMWEERECDTEVAPILQQGTSLLLFVHADRVRAPQWVLDVAALSRKLGLPVEEGKPVPWHPRLAPTQVQLVELLQLMRLRPLDIGRSRLAIILSAWDKVEPERRTPAEFLAERMPLLHQYLSTSDRGEWKVFGVSAQGGDYEPPPGSKVDWSREEREALLLKDKPSERIKLVIEDPLSHDLTEPIAWLTE